MTVEGYPDGVVPTKCLNGEGVAIASLVVMHNKYVYIAEFYDFLPKTIFIPKTA